MPHILIDYSANLDAKIDMQHFCEHLRKVATTIDAFPLAGVRVRAHAAHYVSIADGNPEHAYIDIGIKLRGGRSLAVRQAATQALFDAARDYLAELMATHSLALSMEMRDIDPALSPKCGTVRRHLDGSQSATGRSDEHVGDSP